MAVKSKTQIITDIDRKIITNGDIKAVDTNAILKDILDCRELNASGTSNLSTFGFQSKGPLTGNGNATLRYSLKGINDTLVNIVFRITIGESNVNNLTFIHGDSNIANTLKTIIEDINLGADIDFLVKITNKGNTSPSNKFRIGNLSFRYSDKEFFIKIDGQELNDNLRSGDQIFTSFTIHCPNNF